MKNIMLIFLIFAIAGCGQQEQQNNIDISGTNVTWKGYLNEYPTDDLLKSFDETVDCVQSYGYQTKEGIPYIILVDDYISCNGVDKIGCTDMQVLYITGSTSFVDLWTLKHEAVHWLTGIGDSGHSLEIFQACTIPHYN